MRWIGAHSARRADTTLATQGVQTIEKKPTRYLASTCAFAVAVGRTELVYVVAPPKGNGRWSGELLRYRSAATVARLTKRFNAAVSPDGSMHTG